MAFDWRFAACDSPCSAVDGRASTSISATFAHPLGLGARTTAPSVRKLHKQKVLGSPWRSRCRRHRSRSYWCACRRHDSSGARVGKACRAPHARVEPGEHGDKAGEHGDDSPTSLVGGQIMMMHADGLLLCGRCPCMQEHGVGRGSRARRQMCQVHGEVVWGARVRGLGKEL